MHFQPVSRALLLAVAVGFFSLPAMAQWQWIDKDGRKVYSDRPPPTDVQDKNILKRPAGNRAMIEVTPAPDAAAPAAAQAPAAKASAPKLPGKDPQLEAKKKQAEDEEAAKKKAEDEKVAKARADNCERAKKALVTFQSGVRIAVTNAKGEREVMDDKARATETKRLQGIADTDCKPAAPAQPPVQ